MAERRTKGGHMAADVPASALPFPEVLTRPGAGVVVPVPQDAPPRVPTLPCPKCGETDTKMRWCSGSYSMHWGACTVQEPGDHFHRACPRCTHKWTTYDTLSQDPHA